MIDFDTGQKRLNKFTGSEKKTTILYDGFVYMIKYPDPIRTQKLKGVISYKNNQFSEHIGSSIFNSCGIESQETVLGCYTDTSGKRKTVVGCKDFTQNGGVLYEIDKLSNDIAPDEEKLKTTIENVNRIIDETELIKNKKAIKDGFWNMFIIDALIGNKDRHFGNWGILVKDDDITFAPVYDCGSSLGALLDDGEMARLLDKPDELKSAEYNVPSVYYSGGKRIFYHEIFKGPPSGLAEAIKRTVPKINMEKIYSIVDSTPQISEIRKEYMKKAMTMRYEQIFMPALKRIMRIEKSKAPNQDILRNNAPENGDSGKAKV
ncbi:MAG: HipA domain-containing protein [Oscillospiraceae bacterium]|nr:HipA domain-containing protein [Oscillospiraceae bacterium]